MIRRPGAGELHLAVAHHRASGREFVLIALHIFAIDQMGDVENHLACFGESAAYFFIEGHEKPMHLEAHCAGPGLTFALPGCRFAEIGKVSATHFVGRKLGKLAAAAVIHKNSEVHLGLAAQLVDVAEKLALIRPDGFAEAFVVVEDGAETEGKYSGMFEAVSNNASMIHTRFLI